MSGIQTELGKACYLKAGKFVSASNISENGKAGFYPCYGGNGIRGYVEGYTHEGTFPLIGRQGALCGNVNYASGKFHATEHAVVVQPLMDIDIRWLYYKLLAMNLGQYATGAAQPGLAVATLEKLPIHIPERAEQVKAAAMLDQVSDLIAMRKKQLQKLDDLVKSRFVEMFGDPTTNPQGWDKVNITAVVGGKVSNGFFAKRDDYCDNGNVQILGVANVVNRMYSNTEDLPKTKGTEADIAKYGVKYGDMLFCRSSLVAAGIGKASIVPHGIPDNVLFECHVIRLPLDLNKCVPEFIQVLSTTDYFRNQVIAQSKTATMTTIGQDGILKTEIILPPMDLQKKFLQFVEQTDKSKSTIQQSLDKLELLNKALMQKYFA